MRRPSTVLREIRWSEQPQRLAGWLNPVVALPTAMTTRPHHRNAEDGIANATL